MRRAPCAGRRSAKVGGRLLEDPQARTPANPRTVNLSFLAFQGRLPLAIALLFAMMLGAVIVLAVGAARIFQLRGVARRARRTRVDAKVASGSTRPPVTADLR